MLLCLVFVTLSLPCALTPEGNGLTSWLLFVMFIVILLHNAAFHHGLHCLLRAKQPSGTEIDHNLELSNSDPFKYTIGSPIHVVLILISYLSY